MYRIFFFQFFLTHVKYMCLFFVCCVNLISPLSQNLSKKLMWCGMYVIFGSATFLSKIFRHCMYLVKNIRKYTFSYYCILWIGLVCLRPTYNENSDGVYSYIVCTRKHNVKFSVTTCRLLKLRNNAPFRAHPIGSLITALLRELSCSFC